jgi:hypothetical protein
MTYVDKSFLGRRHYQPKSSTCCICKKPFIGIQKIHIKGPKYVYHCDNPPCIKAAEELADILKEDYGLK